MIFVALGDSFTCGHDPSRPRWPDAVAEKLGARYFNFAEAGATSGDVEERQLPRALELKPALVSLICGANDVLESVRPDPVEYALRLGRMFDRLRPAFVVTATYPPFARFLDMRPRTRARVEKGLTLFNAAARAVAREHGVLLLEGFDHPAAQSRGSFADDGFHPSPEGHRRAATEFVAAVRSRRRAEGALT